ncbi:MAG: exodeoxyribonuclease VII small subunit [Anaerorhabdus sp.]
MTKPTKQTYEESLDRLSEILDRLEECSLPLDEVVALFEEGVEHAENCDHRLLAFEAKMGELVAKKQKEQGKK